MIDFLWRSLVIGIGGTAAMDVWALILKAAFGLALPNWGMVGRWFAHVGKGTIFHDDIGKASPVDNDLEPMGSYQTTADESHRDDRPADVREYAGEMAAFHGC